MSWAVIEQTDRVRHVIPLDDVAGHCEEATLSAGDSLQCPCPCHPRIEHAKDGAIIFVHFAFDNRHWKEWAGNSK